LFFQFSISVFLIISTLTINQQIKFIQNKDIGFDKEQVLVIRNANILKDNINSFKEVLRTNSDLLSVSGSGNLPGERFSNIGFWAEGVEEGFTLNLFFCDYDFQKTLKMEMVEGRFLSREHITDSNAIILNQSACNLLGWDEPLGKKLGFYVQGAEPFTVIGVVKNLHYESLHQDIRPMALLFIGGNRGWSENNISVRLNTENITSTIAGIEKTWNQFIPNTPLEYSFLDDDYNRLYLAEKQMRQFSTILTLLAVFISCVGLFGLASFVTSHKSREISIRRVLGASISGLVGHLNSSFVKWVLLSNLVAWPIAWFVMNRWLQDFAYRVNLDIRLFFIAGIMAIGITLITVSYQSIKAAVANPIDVLRNE